MFSQRNKHLFIVSAALLNAACVSLHPSKQIASVEKQPQLDIKSPSNSGQSQFYPNQVQANSSQDQVNSSQDQVNSSQGQADSSPLKSSLRDALSQEQSAETALSHTRSPMDTSETNHQQSEESNRNDKSGASDAKIYVTKESSVSPSSPTSPTTRGPKETMSPTAGTLSESLSDTVVEGGLSKTTFGRVLQTNREKILICYNKELRINSDAQGLVLTKIDITNTGKVSAVSVLQSDLGDMAFENCIVAAIKRLKFPTPRGGREVRISHPFRFSPGS